MFTHLQGEARFALRALRQLAIGMAVVGAASLPVQAQTAARIDNSSTAQALRKLPRTAGAKPVVTVYEVRSTAPEIQAKAAHEMFLTALVNSGAFAVAERSRLNEGVMRERQLQGAGVTTGDANTQRLVGANYVFEVVISETNVGARDSGGNISIGGMNVGTGSASDQIGMDVRVVDAATGLLVGAVNVVKPIEASSTSVSGLGKLAGAFASLKGKALPMDVDAGAHSSSKEGVDRALRSCIEVAVAELAKRLSQD
jgi:curli biogenesis system outer membrane secretion channel CsgG